MRVLADNQEREDLSSCPPAVVLDVLSQEAERLGRVLTEISVDGVSVDEEAFAALSGGLEARFVSTSVRDLVREGLDTALNYCRQMLEGIEAIASVAEGGDIRRAGALLPRVFEGMNWLLGVYSRCRILIGAPIHPGEEAAVRADILRALERLLEMAGRRDAAGLALCLREEAAPCARLLTFRLEDLRKLGPRAQ